MSPERDLILFELDRLSQSIHALSDRIDDFRKDYSDDLRSVQLDVAMLKVKAGLIGGGAGALPTLCLLALEIIKPGFLSQLLRLQ